MRQDSASKRCLELPLLNYANVQYIVQLGLGDTYLDRCRKLNRDDSCRKSQVLTFIPDTGSHHLWVPKGGPEDLALKAQPSYPLKNRYYSPELSLTYKHVRGETTLGYGDGSRVVGQNMKETMTMDGVDSSVRILHQHALLVPGASVPHMVADGILGLAPAPPKMTLSPTKERMSFLDNLTKSLGQNEPIIGFYLPKLTRSQRIRRYAWETFGEWEIRYWEATRARLTVGTPNPAYFTSSILWTENPLRSQGRWGVEISSLNVGGTSVIIGPALVDTGTSFSLIKPDAFREFKESLLADDKCWASFGGPNEKDETLWCKCPTVIEKYIYSGRRPVSFSVADFGTLEWPITDFMTTISHPTRDAYCLVGIGEGSPNMPFEAILGLTFMQSYYTLFDAASQTVGFARRRLLLEEQFGLTLPLKVALLTAGMVVAFLGFLLVVVRRSSSISMAERDEVEIRLLEAQESEVE
ncbi:MAG: hypothetical protein KVP17_003042 [Porospora cf. gigantea B]|uniref:uncharacterized protein n=1 Tax=Porospora cf. gigantea B TaxID=2853592 RepID=UPI003571C9BD|nr:MAG: hypothetical protein KVP17_003042 [Porospora cf. gigantea B]